MEEIRIITAEDIKSVLTMDAVIAAMEEAFAQYSTGKAANPLRTNIQMPEFNGDALFMPAYLAGSKRIGIKAISLMKENYKISLPFIHAMVLVFSAETGKPEALINGESLTAYRTGAASGAASKHLARKDAASLAIIGAGTQAYTQFEAVYAVRPITKCLVFDTDPFKAEKFIENLQKKYPIQFELGRDKQTLYGCDIICTTSNASGILFDDSNIAPGTHINAIGAYRLDMIEIPNKTVARSKIVVDSREAALTEAGDIINAIQNGSISENSIYAELGEITAGNIIGRASDSEITLFKSVGLAIQDLAAASIVIDLCRENNLGTIVKI